MIDEQRYSVMAAQQFRSVVDQIPDALWDQHIPDFIRTRQTEPVTYRFIINYHAYDDAWVPDMLAGCTMDEVGADKWKGDLLGDDPTGNYARFNETACSAIEALDDPMRTVHCSFGDYSAKDYLLQVLSFRGLRSYEFAKALGIDTALPDELVEGMWKLLTPHADEWRQYGVYQPAIPVADDAPLQRRLLGALGYE